MTNSEESVSMLMRVLRSIRDAWLVVGAVALLIVGLELAYRAQGAARATLGGGRPPDELFDNRPVWMDAYLVEQARTHDLNWRSYVYFRRGAFTGGYINIDSAGHRVTPQVPAAVPARQAFLFGGSTMFGALQRDSGTIAAGVARTLRERAIHDVAVTNFGETGYVLTQGVVELALQLRSGARPAVVVFYDGINDVFSALQNGAPGLPQNEVNRSRDLQFGIRAFTGDHSAGAELGAGVALARAAMGRMELIQRLMGSAAGAPRESAGASLTDRIAESYVSTAQLVAALAQAYGFRALFVWQPSFHATNKPLTPAENALIQRTRDDPVQNKLVEIHRQLPGILDSAMKRVPGVTFLELSRLFARDSAQVFVDRIGHTTEHANAEIVGAIAPVLIELLRAPVCTSGARRGC